VAATAAAVPQLRRFARTVARQWALAEQTVHALSVLVTELVTHAALRSGSADVTLQLTLDSTALSVELHFAGRWPIPPTAYGEPGSGETTDWGLRLVQHSATWWLAYVSPDRTRVVASLPAFEAAAEEVFRPAPVPANGS
jgi:hypothetical protein